MIEHKGAYWYKDKPFATRKEAEIEELSDRVDIRLGNGIALNSLFKGEYAELIVNNLPLIEEMFFPDYNMR